MAFTPSKSYLSLLILFTLLLVIQSEFSLDPSDLDAISIIQQHLGVGDGQRHSFENPCRIVGIFCRRMVVNNTFVLKITRIVFESRQLKGYLSAAIGRLSELRELSLPENQMVDRIPTEIADCRKLEILNLKCNRFSSDVPIRISSLTRLRVLDLSGNKLSGSLCFLKHFPNLEKLSLSDNMFTGKLPPCLKSFRNLRFLNVSGNSLLEGPVPEIKAETNLPKRYIFSENSNATHQTTTAMAPSPSNDVRSTRKNHTSAAAPTGHRAENSTKTPKHEEKKKKNKMAGWITGFSGGVIGGILSGFVVSTVFKLIVYFIRGGPKVMSLAIFSPAIKKPEDLAFLEKEDGLESLEIIGRGGCGEVYKAELSNGKLIAIKRVLHPSMDVSSELSEEDSKFLNKTMRQVKSEIKTVGQIRHRNLLPLLAHMPRYDCHYLVYEYMKNGSLQDVLIAVTMGERQLDWPTRHRIALGVATGLEYLHTHTPRIIHRDLKPGNILLDDHMEVRISDFGLAKVMPDMQTHITTSKIAGTVGYIAPEYHQTLKFTDKCDIYSFGVVLGALAMGKLPSDEFFQGTSEMSLVKWLRNVMTSDEPKRALDSKLTGIGYDEQMLLVLKIACFCTLDNPKERPNGRDVRFMLSEINN